MMISVMKIVMILMIKVVKITKTSSQAPSYASPKLWLTDGGEV